jgi:hypothetical protein
MKVELRRTLIYRLSHHCARTNNIGGSRRIANCMGEQIGSKTSSACYVINGEPAK